MQKVDEHAPVVHVSYFAVETFAHSAGRRLPSEHEWEHRAENMALEGHFADDRLYHPLPLDTGAGKPVGGVAQMDRDVWQ